MRTVLLVPVLLVLAGCAAPAEDSPPGVRSVGGVGPDADGAVGLAAGRGVALETDANASRITVSLADVVAASVLHACAVDCAAFQVPSGAVLAEGGVLSLRNISLNAAGPEGDSAVLFFADGQEAGRHLRWTNDAGRFEANDDLHAEGSLTATHHVGTTTPLVVPGIGLVTVSTAALEGAEATVFARGSARLENGTVAVPLPTAFAALVGSGPITAQVTLTEDGPALFVSERAADRIVVRATGGATSNAAFDWFVQAVRKGSEDFAP